MGTSTLSPMIETSRIGCFRETCLFIQQNPVSLRLSQTLHFTTTNLRLLPTRYQQKVWISVHFLLGLWLLLAAFLFPSLYYSSPSCHGAGIFRDPSLRNIQNCGTHGTYTETIYTGPISSFIEKMVRVFVFTLLIPKKLAPGLTST